MKIGICFLMLITLIGCSNPKEPVVEREEMVATLDAPILESPTKEEVANTTQESFPDAVYVEKEEIAKEEVKQQEVVETPAVVSEEKPKDVVIKPAATEPPKVNDVIVEESEKFICPTGRDKMQPCDAMVGIYSDTEYARYESMELCKVAGDDILNKFWVIDGKDVTNYSCTTVNRNDKSTGKFARLELMHMGELWLTKDHVWISGD